jgi:DNA-binding CsgD family transcriptional regulator
MAEMDLLERDDQLHSLSEALIRAAGGHGCMFAIAGEAGSGKTALVERFAKDCVSPGKVYWGACEHLSTPEPLLPLRDIARSSEQRFCFNPADDHMTSFESLLGLLMLAGPPGVLVLEDVHWADAATLDLIRFLCRRIARARALVIITYRDEEIGMRSALRDVLGEAPTGNVKRMMLEPLSLRSVKQLAERVGRSGDTLFDLTGGNPFLVTEALAVDGDAPPDAVRDATLARAARLPAAGRTVLEAVSIFPRNAEIAVVEYLVGQDLGSGVDACVAKGMLVIDDRSLKFRHEIARRALEKSLAPTRRRELHQKTVDFLKKLPVARASEVVHHAERAGDVHALVEYAGQAGQYAAEMGAHREAAAHYATILSHRDAAGVGNLVDVLECYAEQAYLMGDPKAGMASMEDAAKMRRAAGDAVSLGQDLTRLTRFAWVCGQRTLAERYIAEAIEVLSATSAAAELAWAYSHQSQLDMLAFKNDSAISWGERALELALKLNEGEIVIHALGNIGSARVERDGLKAKVELENSLELAQAAGHDDHTERAWCNLTSQSYWRRDYPSALAYIAQGAAYAAQRDLTHWEAYLRGWRAMIHLDLGDWQAAGREVDEICGWTRTPELYRFPALITLARLRLRRGDPDVDVPLGTARELLANMDEVQRTIFVATVDAERQWLDPTGAGDDEQGVVMRLRSVHDLGIELRVGWIADDSAMWLARLGQKVPSSDLHSPLFEHEYAGRWREAAEGWRSRGCPYEQAMALSEIAGEGQLQALTIFDRLGAAPAASRLRRRMRAAGARAIPRGPNTRTLANPAGLTARQTQVLNLLGEHLSNSEIAERLCISAKTAEHHVGAVMARLNAGSRRDAAAAARKLGLLG